MSEYKYQHQVIIDGYELTPIQSNFVVEAIEQQFDDSLCSMGDLIVDPDEKEQMAPAVLSLAEVITQVNPRHLSDEIEINNKGEASFIGVLSRYNPGGTEEVICPEEG